MCAEGSGGGEVVFAPEASGLVLSVKHVVSSLLIQFFEDCHSKDQWFKFWYLF